MSYRSAALLAASLVLPPVVSGAATLQTTYAFSNSAHGAYPQGGLVRLDGAFYGVTVYGGTGPCKVRGRNLRGCGTVFRVSADGKEHVLHSFQSADGFFPNFPLIALNGVLFGTVADGGGSGSGVVFSITPSGVFTILHTFTGGTADGSNPHSSLTAVNGVLYGTTFFGGANGSGTVFSLAPDGSGFQVLHSFGVPGDGNEPVAALTDYDGLLYGTTESGGAHNRGTVFSLATDGTETVLHSFGAVPDGYQPESALTPFRGKLYGTTNLGGSGACNSGCGTIYSINRTGAHRLITSLTADEPYSAGNLTVLGSLLYGTTASGGDNGDGTLFSVDVGGTLTTLYSFSNNGSTGGVPGQTLINVSGKSLYGVASYGGDLSCSKGIGCGTVFSFTP